jgi:hypothetical protein
MKRRAMLLLVLTAVSLGMVVLASPAEPAWACSCAVGSSQEYADRADIVVIGTVTAVSETGIRLAVESVEKGSLGDRAILKLSVHGDPNSCGYDFRAGARYRVNSTDGATGLCSGNVRLPAAPSALAVAPVVATNEPAPGQSSGWWWFAAGAALTAAIAGVAAVTLRRRSGRADHGPHRL